MPYVNSMSLCKWHMDAACKMSCIHQYMNIKNVNANAPIAESKVQKVRVLMLWQRAEREAKALKESANASEGDQEEDKPRKAPTIHMRP